MLVCSCFTDANTLALVVDNARPEFRSELEASILNDRYSSMHEVVDAAKRMLRDSGPVKAVFYCPLTCEIDDGEGGFSADDRFLNMLSGEIEDALEKDLADVENDMAEYFDEDDGVLSVSIPRSSYCAGTISLVMTIFLNESSILVKGLISCACFASSGTEYADWM